MILIVLPLHLYGITRVPVDYFHYREFRYTSLEDAVAQAQRQRQAG